MTDLASPVVQVVTVGTDWPAIVAAISGGVVGVAGIIFAWRQSKITISAEDARAKLAEKRRIYASCQAALTSYLEAKMAAQATTTLPELSAQRIERSDRERLAAANAVSEISLVGSTEVVRLAQRAILDVVHLDLTRPAREVADAFVELRSAMRRDLGEQALEGKQVPVAPGLPSQKS